jgi:hypothetical protein
MSDFMLIAHADTTSAIPFPEQMSSLVKTLKTLLPKIEWQMEFDLGRGKMVEVFSAPDYDAALDVSRAAQQRGVRAEVSRLKAGW